MSRDTRLPVTTTCSGVMCTSDRPGHAMSLIRLRLAAASGGWTDALVEKVTEDGWVELRLWESGEQRRVWQHASSPQLGAGSPVALHEAYSVLAWGTHRLNVAQG